MQNDPFAKGLTAARLLYPLLVYLEVGTVTLEIMVGRRHSLRRSTLRDMSTRRWRSKSEALTRTTPPFSATR